MSIAERKEREKQQRRKDIIDTAEKKFFEKGFDGVSMDEIASDLELSKPTLYFYFKNKESLFLAVVMRGTLVAREIFMAAVEHETTGIAKVRGFFKRYFEFVEQNRDYYRLQMIFRTRRFINMLMTREIEGLEEQKNIALEVLNLLVDAIRLGQEDGTIRGDIDPLETAIFLSMACESAVQMTPDWELLLEMKNSTRDQYFKHSIDVLLHGIARG